MNVNVNYGPMAGEQPASDILRRAAAKLREATAGVPRGPWTVQESATSYSITSPDLGYRSAWTTVAVTKNSVRYRPHADYLVLWAPEVAESLAAWLESWQTLGDLPEDAAAPDDYLHALAIARALLGETGA